MIDYPRKTIRDVYEAYTLGMALVESESKRDLIKDKLSGTYYIPVQIDNAIDFLMDNPHGSYTNVTSRLAKFGLILAEHKIRELDTLRFRKFGMNTEDPTGEINQTINRKMQSPFEGHIKVKLTVRNIWWVCGGINTLSRKWRINKSDVFTYLLLEAMIHSANDLPVGIEKWAHVTKSRMEREMIGFTTSLREDLLLLGVKL